MDDQQRADLTVAALARAAVAVEQSLREQRPVTWRLSVVDTDLCRRVTTALHERIDAVHITGDNRRTHRGHIVMTVVSKHPDVEVVRYG